MADEGRSRGVLLGVLFVSMRSAAAQVAEVCLGGRDQPGGDHAADRGALPIGGSAREGERIGRPQPVRFHRGGLLVVRSQCAAPGRHGVVSTQRGGTHSRTTGRAGAGRARWLVSAQGSGAAGSVRGACVSPRETRDRRVGDRCGIHGEGIRRTRALDGADRRQRRVLLAGWKERGRRAAALARVVVCRQPRLHAQHPGPAVVHFHGAADHLESAALNDARYRR